VTPFELAVLYVQVVVPLSSGAELLFLVAYSRFFVPPGRDPLCRWVNR
jgi:hypothetical protein